MTTSGPSIHKDSLNDYLNALRDYKKTGYKQTRSILDMLKKVDLTPMQILEMEPGPWLRFVEKIDPQTDEEREFKESIHELMEGLYKKFKSYKVRAEAREDKENANINAADQTSARSTDAEHKKGGISEQREGNSEAPPKAVVDFTVKTLEQGLLVDYKDNPKVKEVVQKLATDKAAELENVIREETKNDPEAYRMEARNVSNFLMTKNNENLREGLLQGDISCEDFVNNKEEFLPARAKEVIQENEIRHYQDVNADFDRKMVPKSELHKCESCGSSRVSFTEKLMSAADQDTTSVLVCADCEHVQLK